MLSPHPPELSRDLSRLLSRIRYVGTLALTALLGLVVVLEPVPWRIAALAVLIAVLVGTLILGVPSRDTPRSAMVTMLFALQLAAILCTGGFDSPLIVVPIPIALMCGMMMPRAAATLRVGPTALVIGLLAVVDVAGWAPGLHFVGADRVGSHELATGLFGGIMVAMMLIGVFFGGIVRDVAESYAQRQRAIEAEARIAVEGRNREILALSGTVAHELKNPLAAIQGLSTLLQRGAEPGSSDAERLEVLVGEVHRMGSILDEFLSFSRPVTELSLATVSLRRLVSQVVLLHEASALDLDLRIDWTALRETPLECDARKVKQILVNLLQNAMEAAPAGSTVRFGGGPEGEMATVWMEDRGSGLAPEIRDRLFSAGATSKPEGSGLGLVISRTLAEQHGGTLEVGAGHDGRGCRATLSLPLEGAA